MDNYTISVGVLDCDEVKKYLKKVKQVERLELDVFELDLSDENSYNQADVLVVGSDLSQEGMDVLFANKANYCEVVLVIDAAHTENLEEIPNIDKYYDIWCLINPIVQYRIYAFLKRMRDTLDKELCEKQLVTLIDSIPDLVWFKDIRGAHKSVNLAFCDTVSKTKEQIRDRGHCYIWDLDPAEYEQGEYVCMETEDIVIEEQKTFLFDEKVKIRDEMRQLKTYKSAILGRRGETIGTVGIAHDVTDIWNTHEEFKTLISRMPYSIMIVDENFEFVDSNEKFEKLFGKREEFDAEFDISQFGNHFFGQDIARKDAQSISLDASMKVEGKYRYYRINKHAIHDMFGKLSGYFYILEDKTESHQYEEKLLTMSETDQLTGLPNRAGIKNFFDMNMPEIIKKQKKLIIYMLDLDYFKQYNDFYGHVAGDKVLQEFAEVLTEVREEYDVFVSRYGGEEFMVACTQRSEEEIREIAELMMKKLRERAIVHEKSLIGQTVSVSVGIACCGNVCEQAVEQLIDSADDALYKAKGAGRNCYILDCY